MIRRPPKSTLFPTRRSSDLSDRGGSRRGGPLPEGGRPRRARRWQPHRDGQGRRLPTPGGERFDSGTRLLRRRGRSEEHTSELQSHHDIVCRLLLEKKKIQDDLGRNFFIFAPNVSPLSIFVQIEPVLSTFSDSTIDINYTTEYYLYFSYYPPP